MILFRALMLFVFATANVGSSAVEQAQSSRNEPYIYCNVYTSGACFGIAQGDKLEMEIVIDYVFYHISFSFGRNATIYSGFNPALVTSQSMQFEKCLGGNHFDECKRRNLNDGGVEFLARPNKNSPFLHVIVSGGTDGISFVESFLQNIRACSKSGNNIRCKP